MTIADISTIELNNVLRAKGIANKPRQLWVPGSGAQVSSAAVDASPSNLPIAPS
jgi:hypothetical protein